MTSDSWLKFSTNFASRCTPVEDYCLSPLLVGSRSAQPTHTHSANASNSSSSLFLPHFYAPSHFWFLSNPNQNRKEVYSKQVLYRSSHLVVRQRQCLKLQVIFCKRATNYRALLRKACLLLRQPLTYESATTCSTQEPPHELQGLFRQETPSFSAKEPYV